MPKDDKDQLRKLIYENITFFDTIVWAENEFNAKAYIVGGTVRDLLSDVVVSDVDIIVFGCDYIEFAKKMARKLNSYAVPFKDNISIMSKNSGTHLADISKARGSDIYSDLALRDFNANSLAIDTQFDLIGSVSDVTNKLIDATYDNSLSDDPIRIVRAYRFMSERDYTITERTKSLIKAALPLLSNTAYERISNELSKLIKGKQSINAVNEMKNDGVLKTIFKLDSFDISSIEKIDDLDDNTLYPFTLAVLIDNDITAIKRLKLSNKQLELIALLYLIRQNIEQILSSIKSKKTFCYKYYSSFDIIIKYLNIKSAISRTDVDELIKLYTTIDMKKAEAVNGDMVKKYSTIPQQEYKYLLDDIKIKLVYNEINESDVVRQVELWGKEEL